MKNFRVLALAALLPLSACGGGGGGGGGGQKSAHAGGKPVVHFFCPQVAVLQQAQTLTLFLPNRQDVAARVSTAQITGVSGSCKLQGNQRTVLVTVNTAFLADNGPANNGAPLDLPWFAAITVGDHIIQKNEYTQHLSFNGNVSSVSATAKPVKVQLPSIPDTQNVQILVGFEETPDQLAYAASNPNAAP